MVVVVPLPYSLRSCKSASVCMGADVSTVIEGNLCAIVGPPVARDLDHTFL